MINSHHNVQLILFPIFTCILSFNLYIYKKYKKKKTQLLKKWNHSRGRNARIFLIYEVHLLALVEL